MFFLFLFIGLFVRVCLNHVKKEKKSNFKPCRIDLGFQSKGPSQAVVDGTKVAGNWVESL